MASIAPQAVAPAPDEAAVGDLCARLFTEPARLDQAVTHAIDHRLYIGPHAHKDLLQLDLITGCEGSCLIGGRWQRVQGLSAMATYPGAEHGYELVPHDNSARVYNVRLRVRANWPAVKQRALQPWATSLDPGRGLVPVMRLLTENASIGEARPALLISRLSEVLCLWPRAGQGAGDMPPGFSVTAIRELDHELSGAITLIHKHVGRPPTLEELAEQASMSPRHFARRFETLLGCTPHAYITARRFARARGMLLQDHCKTHHVADALGFSSPATFSRWFSQHAGVSPRRYHQDPHVM
jgi:AraC family transcriptional regulator